jgi:formylglycine-generating enzyme required for sulfatase activity
MNIKKITVAALAATTTATLTAAVPEVSGATMVQDRSRLVTITYTLADAPAVVTVDVQTNYTENGATKWASIGGAAVANAQGDVWKQVATGNHTITWRPDLSWPDHKIADGGARAVVTAWALDNTPDYMVVDISAGAQPNTQTYYPSADSVPGGVTNSLYKTTALLMRKIMAKDVTWTMGSTTLETTRWVQEATHQVTLTNNYYIGVYEVTQSQWSQVATNSSVKANFTTEQYMRPMEKVCYNEIRNNFNITGQNANYNWPRDPNPSSFLGLLRSKTGIDFDLPSEAQWEFASRSGNGAGYWNDGSPILNTHPDANLNRLGRYINNPSTNSSTSPAATIAPSAGATAIVGSYAPSSWGLYDMHGNVWEWCLDWYQENIATAKDAFGNDYGGRVNIDPSNPANCLSGESAPDARVIRGGCWIGQAGDCRSAFRGNYGPWNRGYGNVGFRVACTAGLQ